MPNRTDFAYPQTPALHPESGRPTLPIQNGMTKREAYAAAALQGLLANPALADLISNTPAEVAKRAVAYGDALRAELGRTQ